MTVRQKILISQFLLLLSLNILKNGQYYRACAARWEKHLTDETPRKEPHCFQHRFQVFFFVKYVVTADDAVDRTSIAIHVVPPRGGALYFRNFRVGMYRWVPGTLNLIPPILE